jgi:5-formyltetrahydrofolate cyclo-ligase
MDIQDAKQQLRKKVALLKRNCTDETLLQLSEQIGQRLEQLPQFRQARCIALYHALAGEVQTAGILSTWYPAKKILLPVVSGKKLRLLPYTGEDSLKKGAFNIMEPTASLPATDVNVDLIIVPGIAFDKQLNRLGRGGGYYDRLLSAYPLAPVIGLCFRFQLFDRIPIEEAHDRKMTRIITEEEIIG